MSLFDVRGSQMEEKNFMFDTLNYKQSQQPTLILLRVGLDIKILAVNIDALWFGLTIIYLIF